jgi:hypothetical protein
VAQVRAHVLGANLGSVVFESTAQTAGGPHNAVFVVWGFYQSLISGDATKAKISYQNFLTLWKEADPDIPILKQAKAEYAKLQ